MPEGSKCKVAVCQGKPYELVSREVNEDTVSNQERSQVILEDSLSEVEKDTIVTKYLRMKNSVSFSESCANIVELPVSEQGI